MAETVNITITNNRTEPLELTPDAFELTEHSEHYTINHGIDPSITIPFQGDFTFSVTYDPNDDDAHDTTLLVRIGNGDILSVELTGMGLDQGELQIVTNNIEFTEWDYLLTTADSQTQSIIVQNTGDIDVEVTDVSIATNPVLSIDTSLPVTVPANSQASVGVIIFSPSSASSGDTNVSSQIDIVNDGSVSPLQFNASYSVLATDATARITPQPAIAFGDVENNSQFTFQGTARLEADSSNNVEIEITDINISLARFEIQGVVFPVVLQPGEFQDLTVKLTTEISDIGSIEAIAQPVTSNQFANTVNTVLTANVLEKAEFNWHYPIEPVFPGSLPVGETHPEPRSVLVIALSTNNRDITLTSGGFDSTEFEIQNFVGVSDIVLAPGESTTLVVDFKPNVIVDQNAVTQRSGRFTLISDSDTGNADFDFTGTSGPVSLGRFLFNSIEGPNHPLGSGNPFGSGTASSDVPFYVDNTFNDYPITITEFDVDSVNLDTSDPLTVEQRNEFNLNTQLPLTIPANSFSNEFSYRREPGAGDTDFTVKVRVFASLENVPVLNLTYRANPFVENLEQTSIESQDFNDNIMFQDNAIITDASSPHDGRGNFVLTATNQDQWYEIHWTNTGTDSVTFHPKMSQMFHNVSDSVIPFSQELANLVLSQNNQFFDRGGVMMRFENTDIWPQINQGGRHPNNAYWRIDQTQDFNSSLGIYTNKIIDPGQTQMMCRVQFFRADPPPMLLALIANSLTTFRMIYTFRVQ